MENVVSADDAVPFPFLFISEQLAVNCIGRRSGQDGINRINNVQEVPDGS